MSEDYKKKQLKVNSRLPPILNEDQALNILRIFPVNRLAFQVTKLDTEDAISMNMKPRPGVPCLKISPHQELNPEDYVVWFYEPVPLTTYLYGLIGLVSVFAVILFPLWPLFMRKGVWYLSMGVLGLIGAFFGLAIVRLIIYVITAVVLRPGLWIFPNLFEDLGVLDSFAPVYGWHGEDSMKMHRLKNKKKKSKKQKERKLLKQKQQEEAAKNPGGPTGPNHGAPAQAPTPEQAAAAQAEIRKQLEIINTKIQAEKQARDKSGKPMTKEEVQQLGQKLFAEYSASLRARGGPNLQFVAGNGPPPPNAQPIPQGPVRRGVQIEEIEE